MNEQQSRTLDYWFGIPLCWLFTRWRRLADWLRPPRLDEPPRKILFIKLAEMGAIALAMPAFETAARRVGRGNVFCLMLEPNREMHDLVGFFAAENLLSIRDENLFVFARDVWRLMQRCRAERIDAVVDLEGFSRISALLSWLTGARMRAGFARYTSEGLYRGDLLTHRVWLNYYDHASAQFVALVRALEKNPHADVLVKERIDLSEYRLPRFEPTSQERAALLELLKTRCGWAPGRPLALFNPNLVDLLPLRRWPRERWLELGRRLIGDSPELTIALVGLGREREESQRLAAEISSERCFSLAGETTIRSLATLFTLADILISSDSGPPHMAAFAELATVSIFGPETPRLYAPLNPRNVSLWSNLACSPCLTAFNHRRSACRDNVCTQVVTAQQAWEAATRLSPQLRQPALQTVPPGDAS